MLLLLLLSVRLGWATALRTRRGALPPAHQEIADDFVVKEIADDFFGATRRATASSILRPCSCVVRPDAGHHGTSLHGTLH
jgi:hypothetical protein